MDAHFRCIGHERTLMPRVLVIEDDGDIAALLVHYL